MNPLGKASSHYKAVPDLNMPQIPKFRKNSRAEHQQEIDNRIVSAFQEYQGPESGKWVAIAKNVNEPGWDCHKCQGRYKKIKVDEKYYHPEVLNRVKEIAQKWLPANEHSFAFEVSSMLSTEFNLILSHFDCIKKYKAYSSTWTQDETTQFIDLTKRYPSEWQTIASQIGTKNPQQCKSKLYNLAKMEKKRKLENPTVPNPKKFKI